MDLFFNTNFLKPDKSRFIGKTSIPDPTDSFKLPDKLYQDKNLKIGVVIGTYASLPYINLGLESWKRNYPHVSMLVHDDCSRSQNSLEKLCNEYGCDFETNNFRMPPCVGDLTAYLGGFYWAQENNIDILVKMSRRFIPTFDWTIEMLDQMQESQFATYTSYCDHFNFGFRSECVAMHVPTWFNAGLVSQIKDKVIDCKEIFVEGFLHQLAKSINHRICHVNDTFILENPMPPEKDSYGVLKFMGDKRVTAKSNLLWHDSHNHVDYYYQAIKYGINFYNMKDFEDPNQ
jgi:hypothetical protein